MSAWPFLLSAFASVVIGAVFLLTGLVKTLAPTPFVSHLSQLTSLSGRPLVGAACFFTILECLTGAVLICRVYGSWTFPAAIGLLVVLSAVSVWNIASRRTDSCGCYGQLISVSPPQSLALNGVYAILLAGAWLYPQPWPAASGRDGLILAFAGAILSSVNVMSFWSYFRFGKGLCDFSPMKVSQPWKNWISGCRMDDGLHLVVFISPDCQVCHQWIRPLNILSRRAGVPKLVAALAASPEEAARFTRERGVEFPVFGIGKSLAGRLVESYPTAVRVSDGIITERRQGSLPPDLVEILKTPEPKADADA
jgi:hypothetical protein